MRSLSALRLAPRRRQLTLSTYPPQSRRPHSWGRLTGAGFIRPFAPQAAAGPETKAGMSIRPTVNKASYFNRIENPVSFVFLIFRS